MNLVEAMPSPLILARAVGQCMLRCTAPCGLHTWSWLSLTSLGEAVPRGIDQPQPSSGFRVSCLGVRATRAHALPACSRVEVKAGQADQD